MITLERVNFALVAKKQHGIVGARRQQEHHFVFAFGRHAIGPTPTPPLSAIRIGQRLLNIATLCQRNQDILIGNEFFVFKAFAFIMRDARAALISIFITQSYRVIFDDLQYLFWMPQQIFKIQDLIAYF